MSNPTWDFSAKPYTDPAPAAGQGATGSTGANGSNGTTKWDSGATKNVCDTAPTDGKPGGPGQTPATPPQALTGRPTAVVTQNLGLVTGNITIWYGAGDGQVGGAGGQGGNGGAGGTKGTNPGPCTDANDGAQGPAGQGGNGGQGGDGGTTGLITIYYRDGGATFKITQVGCGGGNGGAAGGPGTGVGGGGWGSPGASGNPSVPPQIKINKQ